MEAMVLLGNMVDNYTTPILGHVPSDCSPLLQNRTVPLPQTLADSIKTTILFERLLAGIGSSATFGITIVTVHK